MRVHLEAGTSIAHYRVVDAIGAGGMGEVYRARDSKLDRDVALKVLPPDAFRDRERVVRFINEAKAASSLNHPNIVTIHEIGEATLAGSPQPVHYIAMELIEGVTLGSRIHDRDVPLKTLLADLAQTADGLAKAHAAGIVHRDLKPENIMITRDGYAKILDFGLAKLTIAASSDPAASVAPTERHTREGTVMGTVGYMSPEQIGGQAVDQRSDIFSFGCVLYEAVTRRRPFAGDSDIDVMHTILHDDPPPVEQFAPSTPAVLRRLIRRCLAKDRDQRLQSMKDIALELHDVVNEFDHLSPWDSSAVAHLAKHRRWPLIAAAASAALIVIVAAWLVARRGRAVAPPRVSAHPESMRIDRVTNIGQVHGAAISPDGKYVAYTVWDREGKSSIFIRQIATSADARIVGPIAGHMWRIRYTPDGTYLYYVMSSEVQTIYRVPSVGGTPQKITVDEETPPAFTPDGSKFAFVRADPHHGRYLIQMANADGSGDHAIATLPPGPRSRRSRTGLRMADTSSPLLHTETASACAQSTLQPARGSRSDRFGWILTRHNGSGTAMH